MLQQLALVSEVQDVSFSELATVSAALQKQATRDLAPIWGIEATVDPFADLADVPIGYWPIIVVRDVPNAAGVHLDQNGQPFALVEFDQLWSLTASHECQEMLVDPFGNRLVAGISPKKNQGRVEFLVEVCDPSEAQQFGYTVNGVLVSDFYTPSFFDPVKAAGVRYSFTGSITGPRQVLRGGYLSWHDPVTNNWWQLIWFGPNKQFRNLGVLARNGQSIRSAIDRLTIPPVAAAGRDPKEKEVRAERALLATVRKSTYSKADSWRAQIKALKAQGARK